MFWTLSKVSLLNYTNIVDEQSIFTSTTRISEISKGDISMIYCSSSIIEMKKIVITTSALLYKKWPYSEFFWSAFSWIRTKYGNLQSKSPYSVRMRENADQRNSEYEYFSHRACREHLLHLIINIAQLVSNIAGNEYLSILLLTKVLLCEYTIFTFSRTILGLQTVYLQSNKLTNWNW